MGPWMITRVGLVVVHGIGEQRRFEHLDQQLRSFMEQLRADHPGQVTVEIASSPAAANLADQDTWRAGPEHAVRVILAQGADQVHFHVHEVWWADINEPYSIMKQLRFWIWGLSVWWFPKKLASNHPLAQDRMVAVRPTAADQTAARFKIYWIGAFFLNFSLFIGLFFNLLKRLFNIEAPDLLRTFVNYLSSIKLYNQPVRSGLGLSSPPADYLDALGEPPRVSIRRRMVRTLADVACRQYDRWYVVAHSLGSVVAFNGLMEPAYAFPCYLDEERWQALVGKGLGGPAGPGYLPPAPGEPVSPARPGWLAPDDVAYRPRIFERFGGLITHGCPLGKFSAIWPALIPFCREPAFPPQSHWINVFDPLDPVSGPLDAMNAVQTGRGGPLDCFPRRTNLGYRSSNILLQAHVTYFDRDVRRVSLLELVIDWFASGDPRGVLSAAGPAPTTVSVATGGRSFGRFFPHGSAVERGRQSLMLIEWLAANLFVIVLNTLLVWGWLHRDELGARLKALVHAAVAAVTGAPP